MSLALALVLASALTHAVWNAMLKHSGDPPAEAFLISLGAAGVSAALAVGTGAWSLPRAAWLATGLSGAIEAVYFVTLAGALVRLPLGTGYGIARGGGLLLTWPLSVWLMGEGVDWRGGLGGALVAGGLWSLVSGGRGAGIPWALACAAAVGVYPLAYQAALKAGAQEFLLFAWSLGISLPVQWLMLGPQRNRRLRATLGAEPGRMGTGALLCAASFLFFLAALAMSGAGWAASLRNSSVVFATLAGWARGDPRTWRSALTAALIAAGAVLLAR